MAFQPLTFVSLEVELARYSAELAAQPRWLVLNKLDLVPENAWDEYRQELIAGLDWAGPAYTPSAPRQDRARKTP